MKCKAVKWAALCVFVLAVVGFGAVSIVSYLNTITPNGIVIHHSATMPYRILIPSDVQAISHNHQKKGFSTFYWGKIYHIGYHYIILPDGTVISGRPETSIGAHAAGYNSYIGICLIGNFTEKDDYPILSGIEKPSPEQMNSLIGLTGKLRESYQIPTAKIYTHQTLNPKTECPGENFPMNDFLEQIDYPGS